MTTASPEALRYYVEGQRHLHNNGFPETIAYMERAVELDPDFAMAYATLAFAHGYMHHDAEQHKYLKKALELSARLPENERLLIEGRFLLNEQDYAKAIEVLGRLVTTYPGRSQGYSSLADAYFGAGEILNAVGQEENAVQIQKTARGIDALAKLLQLGRIVQEGGGCLPVHFSRISRTTKWFATSCSPAISYARGNLTWLWQKPTKSISSDL